MLELGREARLLKISDEDLRLLRPGTDDETVCRELLAGELTELVVLTRGAEGATAFTDGATLPVAAPPPTWWTRWAPGTRSWRQCWRCCASGAS